MLAPRSLSHKVAVTQQCSLSPTPPLSPTSSSGSFAESLEDDDDPAPEASSQDPHSSQLTVPPPGALVYPQRVHRAPTRLSRRERARLRYGGVLFDVLEPWESVVVHALLVSLVLVAYLALSRLVAAPALARLARPEQSVYGRW